MKDDPVYQHFLDAALRNAVRLGCRQLVSFHGDPDIGADFMQLRRFSVSMTGGWREALLRSGFDPRQRSFGNLSGLSGQTPKAVFQNLLRDIASLWSRGSSLASGYSAAPLFEKCVCYEPLEMELLLSDCGFLVYAHPDADELARQYFRESGTAQPVLIPPGYRCLLAVKQ